MKKKRSFLCFLCLLTMIVFPVSVQAADILGISHTIFYRRYRKEIKENVSNGRR